MKINEFSLLIGGEAGDGISSAGYQFSKACIRGGLHAFATNDYQSTIRGGHNFYTIRAKDEPVYSQGDTVDLVVALNAETATRHKDELVPGGGIVHDKNEPTSADQLSRQDIKLYLVPLSQIVLDLKGPRVMRNAVGLGAAIALIDYDLTLLEGIFRESFRENVAEANVQAARKGYAHIKENYKEEFGKRLEKVPTTGERMIFPSGNEATGLGAIRAGCKFYSAYPMTPSTAILHFMAQHGPKYNMITIHPEGEIAAIQMAAGAATAGARAMTATSGGGFSLMVETLGMLGMTEVPLVIVEGQRTGPSTGLPTYSAQGDLRFVLHAAQGEFPRVVIAPGDVEETFCETMRAFNWAEKYQLPVILLTDKYLAESQMSIKPFDVDRVKVERGDLIKGEYKGEEEYKRHRFTETGVSPRALPGTKGALVRTSADEHDEHGFTAEDEETTTQMIDKRMRKLDYLAKELEERKVETTKLHGPEEADATIIAWGSTKGPIFEAMKLLKQNGRSVNYLQVIYLMPFPTSRVRDALNKAKRTIVVENNKTSQLTSLIREHTLKDIDTKILKYDGRPFNPGYLSERIKEAMRG